MDLTEQDTQYILNAVAQRPLAEALPLFLKLTNQKLVPADAAQPIPIRAVPAGDPGL